MDAKRLDLGAIKAREQAATPGPWHEAEMQAPQGFDLVVVADVSKEMPDGSANVETIAWLDWKREANLPFIAHARQDIPALIEALEAERRENERLRDAVDSAGADIDWLR